MVHETQGDAVGDRRRMDVQDALWLEMDRPTNLMVIDSVMWTATPIDWSRFDDIVRHRLWERYRVFRSAAVRGDDGAFYWEERDGFDLADHLTRVVLPAPGGDAELHDLVSSLRTVPLDRERPLWQVICVDGYHGGSAILARTHHALADGVRMVQIAMSLLDASAEGGAILAPGVEHHAVARRRSGAGDAPSLAGELAGFAADATTRVRRVVGDPIRTALAGLGAVRHVTARAVATSETLGRTPLTNPFGVAHNTMAVAAGSVGSMGAWLRRAFEPRLPGAGPMVDLVAAAAGDVDLARKLLLGTRNDAACWTGVAGTRKAVAWSEPIALARVKAVAAARGVTVNDVLVTCVAGSLHAYLVDHHSACASVNLMIPVNLKALDTTLPDELGNNFALVQLELPTDRADPLAVLDVVSRRMGRIKHGHEVAVAFGVQASIAGLGATPYRAMVDLLASRASGVLTNVPGPPVPVYLAGTRVEGIVGWAPVTGNLPMSFTVCSYDGRVFIGIACDVGLVPDHGQIVDGFAAAFERLAIAHR
jgi:diacylglycerol O-acyltransferase